MTVTLETGSQVELNGHHPCPLYICRILSVPFKDLCPFASLSLISLKSDQVKQNKPEMSGWVPPASFLAESSHVIKNTRALSEWVPVEEKGQIIFFCLFIQRNLRGSYSGFASRWPRSESGFYCTLCSNYCPRLAFSLLWKDHFLSKSSSFCNNPLSCRRRSECWNSQILLICGTEEL